MLVLIGIQDATLSTSYHHHHELGNPYFRDQRKSAVLSWAADIRGEGHPDANGERQVPVPGALQGVEADVGRVGARGPRAKVQRGESRPAEIAAAKGVCEPGREQDPG